ncbi:MAG: hypothetical protein LAN83_16120, partial [Acidobacteriia bacterium]|nr:hypothetical protein [Terriglobia bacterium]
MDFDISAACPGGTTSAAGKATICGNNNTVTVSINGQPAFALQPGQPGPIGPQGPAGPAGATGLKATCDDYFPSGKAFDPMSEGYIEVSNGAETLLLRRSRSTIEEPFRYEIVS